MIRMTFRELVDHSFRVHGWDIHIVIDSFGEQILCNKVDFRRASKLAMLLGAEPYVHIIDPVIRDQLCRTNLSLEELNNLWK